MSVRHPFHTRVHARNGSRLLVVIGLVFLGTIGCGDDSTEPQFDPGFMVGEWLADSLVVTSEANPAVFADLTALGAVYTLSVQPSGRYTTILQGFGPSTSEFGNLTVDGAEVVFIPQFGEESRELWERVGESVILEVDTQFDFDLDGMTEAGILRRVLIPR